MEQSGGRPSREEMAKLPSGRHHLSRNYVVGNQLGRILQAVIQVVGEKGYAGLTVDTIIAASGVSRRTFYQLFKNKDEAFIAAYDLVASRVAGAVRESMTVEGSPVEKMNAGLAAFLEHLAAEPLAARMAIVEVLAAGPVAIERRAHAKQLFIATIADYLRRADPDWAEPELTGEGIAGAVLEIVYSRIRRGAADTLPSLYPSLIRMFAMPRRSRAAD